MEIARIEEYFMEIPNVRYSFFDSPYPPHREGAAVDVYFEEEVLFPFEEGKLIDVRKIRTPRNTPHSEDHLLIFEVGSFCLKVLHVRPKLGLGEKVYLEDDIGEMVPSGYFCPWTDRHAHFEIRPCGDRYRSRGGITLVPIIRPLVPVAAGNEFEVVGKEASYIWLRPIRSGGRGMTPLGSVEGGLPHFGYGAIFGGREAEVLGIRVRGDNVLPNGVSIFHPGFSLLASGKEVRGLGIYCNEPRLKLIGGSYEVGDTIGLEIR